MYVLIYNLFMISFFSDSGTLPGLVMALASLVASSILPSGFSGAIFPRASLGPYSTSPPGHAGLLHLDLDPTLTTGYVVCLLYSPGPCLFYC